MHQELYQNVEDPNVVLILNGTYVHVVQVRIRKNCFYKIHYLNIGIIDGNKCDRIK